MRLHLFTAPLAFGATVGVVAPAAAVDLVADVVLARSALAAIDADPHLRDVNLIVSVVDRVAVIGGPVSSADVGKRAEAVVRGVGGIADVKNRCFVQDKPDPLLRAVADRLGVPRPLLAELPGVVTPPRPAATSDARPPENAYAALTPPAPAETEVVARRPANLSVEPAGGFLGAPEALPAARGAAAMLTATGTPPPPAAGTAFPARPTDVLASAEAIRKADARFKALAVEMKSGTLVIGGQAPRAADAWDFAQALRRVPGVARVVVGAVAAK